MADAAEMRIVARIRNDYTDKFAVPRQSGLADEVLSEIILEPDLRSPDVYRGIEGFSHLWLIWLFDRNTGAGWSPTVRPPRLGGNARMGVFATRSPFRPNPIGLSCVRLTGVRRDERLGPVLTVAGADLADGTPILDIKPYLPYADARPDASAGFTEPLGDRRLTVRCPDALKSQLTADERRGLLAVLSRDPRPGYQRDPDRVYGFTFAGREVRFTVDGDVLTVREIGGKEETDGLLEGDR